MQTKMTRLLAAGFLALGTLVAQAQVNEFTTYVGQCKSSLGFVDSDIPATIDCYDGVLFDTEPPASDYVVYRRVNDQVDLTMACRWLGGNKQTDRRTAISIEMMLHNRQNGNTCVFSGKQVTQFAVPSLTTGVTSAGASSFWHPPSHVNSNGPRCVGCHVSGPYISTPKIAPVLAKYGLLNNGHDTLSNMSFADLGNSNPNVHAKYHFIGAAFSTWDSERNTFVNTSDSSCSQGCHLVGTNSPQGSIGVAPAGDILKGPVDYLNKIFAAGVMPPYSWDSHYRWMNLDTAGDGSEQENFAKAMTATSTLVPNIALPVKFDGNFCPTGNVPQDMEVHAVGVDVENSFSYSGLSNVAEKFRNFNLKDGLVCLNADQDPGVSCRDFDVSYLCPSGTWTSTFWNHTVNSNGGDDHEERSFSNSAIRAACGNKDPVGIRARYFIATRGGQSAQIFIGPNDRLARMSQYGITCNTSEQPDGKCSNYVVRYQGCVNKPVTENHRLSDVFTGKFLTASSSVNGAAVRNTASASTRQTWAIEHVTNTEYVRLKNTTTGTYLNVTSSAEQATVVTSTGSSATSQMWIIEPVVFAPLDFRFRNLSTGKYLTSQDPALAADKANLAVYSQGKNPSWTSQRWVIN
jgi:hypothetical protein